MSIATSTTETQLTPKLSQRWQFGVGQLLCCAWFACFFIYASYVPLFHTDIWGHVLYGHWILDHQALPTQDPFLPLAEGMPVVDTAWLAQVIFGAVDRWAGPEGISILFALTTLATQLLMFRTFLLQTGRLGQAMACLAVMGLLGGTRHAIVRPEVFGVLCFATLWWLIVRSDRASRSKSAPSEAGSSAALWLGVPLLFMLWANLHGSFMIGLIVLGCYAAGRAVEVAGRTWSLRAVFADREFRRWLLFTELATVSSLVNPLRPEAADLHIAIFAEPQPARRARMASAPACLPRRHHGLGGRAAGPGGRPP